MSTKFARVGRCVRAFVLGAAARARPAFSTLVLFRTAAISLAFETRKGELMGVDDRCESRG